jgi:choline dehydrogenase
MSNTLSTKSYHYIIVGAGSAGSLLANRLSADPNNQVLLLEAGGKDNYPWIHIPIGYLYCIDNPRTDWCFRTEADPGLNGRQLLYPRGKTLGGCSSINGMIYMRGQAQDYDQWAADTVESQWSWENVLPDFMAHESHFSLDTANSKYQQTGYFHGANGEWRVEQQRLRWDILDCFSEAAVQAGIPATEDFNTGDNFGVGYFDVNQRKGWRWNTAKAFLHPIRKKRSNLTIVTRVQAKRLLFANPEQELPLCNGVELAIGDILQQVFASKEVILCAGAIGTPHLLQLSGIGPGELLTKYAIPVVQELPGVGENLQDHLQIRTVFKVKGARTLNTLASTWLGKLRIGIEYALFQTGPMSMAPSQLGAFARSDSGQAQSNIEFHVQPLSLDAFGDPLHNFPAFTASVCNLKPSSRGQVKIQSADYRQAPLIIPNYLNTSEDRKVAADSIRVARNIVVQSALAQYQPEELKPGLEYQSDDELAKRAGDIATTIFHPVGTAKMGARTDPMAVVDPRLKVHGVKNLRVVDASVMPMITSGNTNSPSMMIAEKAARWILSQ